MFFIFFKNNFCNVVIAVMIRELKGSISEQEREISSQSTISVYQAQGAFFVSVTPIFVSNLNGYCVKNKSYSI